MKRKLVLLMILLLNSFQINNVLAYENQLKDYEAIINEINIEFDTSFQIISESDFYDYGYDQLLNKSYDEYIGDITKTDLETFKNEMMKVIEESEEDIIDVEIYTLTKSIEGEKTVRFYSGHNSMTLRYRYSGSKFDTSYEPDVTVKKLTTNTYFQMNSYSGKFINSNKTYSVTAYGKIINYNGVVTTKTFTINFNL